MKRRAAKRGRALCAGQHVEAVLSRKIAIGRDRFDDHDAGLHTFERFGFQSDFAPFVADPDQAAMRKPKTRQIVRMDFRARAFLPVD